MCVSEGERDEREVDFVERPKLMTSILKIGEKCDGGVIALKKKANRNIIEVALWTHVF